MEAFALELATGDTSGDYSSSGTLSYTYQIVLDALKTDFPSTGRTFDNDGLVGVSIGNDGYYMVAQATDGSVWYLRSSSGVVNINATQLRAAPGSGASSISTQQLAQEALKTLETAIISKDNIRASLGALQNRPQNTITNLSIQAENLQAAESRISDADVALEMTKFVRNQILTQAAVAMLAQANSLPRMAMQLIGG
jgi:flagellin-like hook-associated protein FlgL